MNSLRDMMETTFAAAAFGERGLHDDARALCGRGKQSRVQEGAAKTASKVQRPRPSLKA